jgi:hypothetical protein
MNFQRISRKVVVLRPFCCPVKTSTFLFNFLNLEYVKELLGSINNEILNLIIRFCLLTGIQRE